MRTPRRALHYMIPYWGWQIAALDRIVVLDEGRIVQMGRHADLVSCDGLYARLFALQFSGEAEQVASA